MKTLLVVIAVMLSSCATAKQPEEVVHVMPPIEIRPDPMYDNMLPQMCIKGTTECVHLPAEAAKAIVNGIAAMVLNGASI